MTNTVVDKINSRAMLTLSEMWNHAINGMFCDVTIVASLDGKKITAHRSVLCAANDYFQRMFCGEFKESYQKEVIISQVSGDVLLSLVEYCYTGRIDINEDNVELILPQASFMLFSDIVEACSHFQMTLINSANCLSIAQFAKFYHCEDLLKCAEEHAKDNFADAALTEDYLNLSLEELEKYISSDELSVENEKEVFQAVLRWVNHDFENRNVVKVSKLLPLIRFNHIESSYLLEYVVKNNLKFSEGINSLRSQTTPERTGFISNQIVFVCTKKIQIYNKTSNNVKVICDIPSDIGPFEPTLVGEKLILVCINGKVRSFDLITKTWHEFQASMLTRRYRSSVEVLDNSVYVVGGCINGIPTNTVERWDLKLNSCSRVTPMRYARQYHCTAIANGKLYAIGGILNDTFLNIVECYDPIADNWRRCSPLLAGRCWARTVTVNNEIFVFGGFNYNSGILNSIEKYNPEKNTWINVGRMSTERMKMGATLLKRKIFLYGGETINGTWQKTGEVFDPLRLSSKSIECLRIDYKDDLFCFPYPFKNKK